MSLNTGDTVVLHGLVGRDHLNGAVGTLECREASTGRWRVRLHRPPWSSVKVSAISIEVTDEPIKNVGAERAIERTRSTVVPVIGGALQFGPSSRQNPVPSPRVQSPKTTWAKEAALNQGPLVVRGDLYRKMVKEIPRDPRAAEPSLLRNLGLSYFKEMEVSRRPRRAPQDPVPRSRSRPEVPEVCLPALSSEELVAITHEMSSRWVEHELAARKLPAPVGVETPDLDCEDCDVCRALDEKAGTSGARQEANEWRPNVWNFRAEAPEAAVPNQNMPCGRSGQLYGVEATAVEVNSGQAHEEQRNKPPVRQGLVALRQDDYDHEKAFEENEVEIAASARSGGESVAVAVAASDCIEHATELDAARPDASKPKRSRGYSDFEDDGEEETLPTKAAGRQADAESLGYENAFEEDEERGAPVPPPPIKDAHTFADEEEESSSVAQGQSKGSLEGKALT